MWLLHGHFLNKRLMLFCIFSSSPNYIFGGDKTGEVLQQKVNMGFQEEKVHTHIPKGKFICINLSEDKKIKNKKRHLCRCIYFNHFFRFQPLFMVSPLSTQQMEAGVMNSALPFKKQNSIVMNFQFHHLLAGPTH